MKLKHPREMYLLTLTEMFQRCAFWGVANLLVLYFVQAYQMEEARADTIFGWLTGVAFALPVVGGFIADRTSYKLVVILGVSCTAIGAFLMAIESMPFTYLALVFLSLGTGLGTPGVYAILGQIYHDKHSIREGGFSIFYSIVNLGIFFAMITLGWLATAHGWNKAFLIAGFLALAGLVPFFRVMKSPVFLLPHHMISFSLKREKPAPLLKKHEKDRIIVICVLSLVAILLWCGMNQGGSSLTLFALKYTDRKILDFTIPPPWFLAVESLFLFLLVYPATSFYLYLAKKKKDPSPPMKCALALIALGLCFTVVALCSLQIPSGATFASVTPFCLVGAYVLMSVGELFLTPIGLSLITHLSPNRYTALLIGVWYLCIGIGLYLGGKLAGLMSKFVSLASFFSLFVLIFFIGAAILLLAVRKLNRMRHIGIL